MEINSVGSGAQSSRQPRPETVDYNSFLQLLVTQMKNQDPMNPADGTQFLSQLASFSAVEQSVQMNSKLDSLISSSLLSQAGSVIGRNATAADGSVSGRIESVSLSEQRLVAALSGGATLIIGDGVIVS